MLTKFLRLARYAELNTRCPVSFGRPANSTGGPSFNSTFLQLPDDFLTARFTVDLRKRRTGKVQMLEILQLGGCI
jgi:hypothetical protein